MKHEQTQKSAILPWARKTAGNTSRQIARACLATVDWYHREWLRVKQGERAVAPTSGPTKTPAAADYHLRTQRAGHIRPVEATAEPLLPPPRGAGPYSNG